MHACRGPGQSILLAVGGAAESLQVTDTAARFAMRMRRTADPCVLDHSAHMLQAGCCWQISTLCLTS